MAVPCCPPVWVGNTQDLRSNLGFQGFMTVCSSSQGKGTLGTLCQVDLARRPQHAGAFPPATGSCPWRQHGGCVSLGPAVTGNGMGEGRVPRARPH